MTIGASEMIFKNLITIRMLLGCGLNPVSLLAAPSLGAKECTGAVKCFLSPRKRSFVPFANIRIP